MVMAPIRGRFVANFPENGRAVPSAVCKTLFRSQAALPAAIPRVSRLMALAIHFDGLIRKGTVRDYADLARLGGVTRARITQIMNLLNLALTIQERLLFLQGAAKGRDAVTEREMRRICEISDWDGQQEGWTA